MLLWWGFFFLVGGGEIQYFKATFTVIVFDHNWLAVSLFFNVGSCICSKFENKNKIKNRLKSCLCGYSVKLCLCKLLGVTPRQHRIVQFKSAISHRIPIVTVVQCACISAYWRAFLPWYVLQMWYQVVPV